MHIATLKVWSTANAQPDKTTTDYRHRQRPRSGTGSSVRMLTDGQTDIHAIATHADPYRWGSHQYKNYFWGVGQNQKSSGMHNRHVEWQLLVQVWFQKCQNCLRKLCPHVNLQVAPHKSLLHPIRDHIVTFAPYNDILAPRQTDKYQMDYLPCFMVGK